MRRWWWLGWLAGGLAMAGPLELVPAGHSSYDQLAVLRRSGLLPGISLDHAGVELTRFEFAQLWTVAYEELQRRADGAAGPVSQPDPQVRRATAALAGLLTIFSDELRQRDVDVAGAREFLRTVPDRLDTLEVQAPPPVKTVAEPRPGADETYQPRSSALRDDPFALGTETLVVPGGGGTSTGGRLPLPALGMASAGVSLREVALFEYDDAGPSEFLKGHVLAADLRLRMGDNSVLLEYARSASDRFGALFGGEAGDAFKATYERELTRHLSVDLGIHRLSSQFTPFSEMFAGQSSPDVYGVRAGLALATGDFGLQSHATVYRPEGEKVGYANRFDTAMSYRVNDHFQLGLGFMTSTRRRLSNLEDAMLRQVTASLDYGLSDSLRTSINLQLDSDQSGGTTTSDQYIGASLGLGF